MTRLPWLAGVVWTGLLIAGAAGGQDAATLKPVFDRTANWLIDQHNLNEGTFGKGKNAKQPGVVALVLKALAEMPRKYREAHGPYISQPVKYLLSCQQENGAFAVKEFGRETYTTALAVLALESLQNPKHAPAIERGRAYLLTCQGKDGGFGYGSGTQGSDLSNTWFALTALSTPAYPKAGDAFKNAVPFIRACQDNPETNPDPAGKKGDGTGGAYYKPGQSEAGTVKTRAGDEVPKPYGSMTAAALEGFLLCGLKTEAPEVQAALKFIRGQYNVKENPGAGMQGYYYYSLASTRALRAANVLELELPDGKKAAWYIDLAAHLLTLQQRSGSFVNSEARWLEDDPIVCTAYALQTLSICNEMLKKAEKK